MAHFRKGGPTAIFVHNVSSCVGGMNHWILSIGFGLMEPAISFGGDLFGDTCFWFSNDFGRFHEFRTRKQNYSGIVDLFSMFWIS